MEVWNNWRNRKSNTKDTSKSTKKTDNFTHWCYRIHITITDRCHCHNCPPEWCWNWCKLKLRSWKWVKEDILGSQNADFSRKWRVSEPFTLQNSYFQFENEYLHRWPLHFVHNNRQKWHRGPWKQWKRASRNSIPARMLTLF